MFVWREWLRCWVRLATQRYPLGKGVFQSLVHCIPSQQLPCLSSDSSFHGVFRVLHSIKSSIIIIKELSWLLFAILVFIISGVQICKVVPVDSFTNYVFAEDIDLDLLNSVINDRTDFSTFAFLVPCIISSIAWAKRPKLPWRPSDLPSNKSVQQASLQSCWGYEDAVCLKLQPHHRWRLRLPRVQAFHTTFVLHYFNVPDWDQSGSAAMSALTLVRPVRIDD